MKAPLQMIAFDDDGTRDLSIGPSLKLRPNVDQDGAVLDCFANLMRLQPRQPEAGPGEEPAQSIVIAFRTCHFRCDYVLAPPSSRAAFPRSMFCRSCAVMTPESCRSRRSSM